MQHEMKYCQLLYDLFRSFYCVQQEVIIMKEITIIIQHGLVTRVIAEEEVKVVFMNLDGGHEDQKGGMDGGPYYVDEYIADVDKEELAAIKKVLRNE